MTIKSWAPSSRKRPRPTGEDDAELGCRSTLPATAEDGWRRTSRSLLIEELDIEQEKRRKRIRALGENGGGLPASSSDAGSDSDGGVGGGSCEECSTSSPCTAAPPADQDPYVSFGEEADPVYKRIRIAAYKYHHALDSNKLLGRLHDLPTENEYVPRKMHDSTPATPDSDSTVVATPSYYRRSSSHWERMENETRESPKSFAARFGLKVIVNDPPPANSQLDDQNSASPEANAIYPAGELALEASRTVDKDINRVVQRKLCARTRLNGPARQFDATRKQRSSRCFKLGSN